MIGISAIIYCLNCHRSKREENMTGDDEDDSIEQHMVASHGIG